MRASVQHAPLADSGRLARPGMVHELITLGLAGLTVICLQALLIPAHVPLALKAQLVLIVIATLIRPFAGLLIAATLVPFSALAALVSNVWHVLWADATIFAFVSSWWLAARAGGSRWQFGSRLSSAGLLLGIIIAASLVAEIPGLSQGGFVEDVWRLVARDLFFVGRRTAGVAEGLGLLFGLALLTASISLCRIEPNRARTLAAAMVGSAVAASVLNILLARGVALEPVLERARLLPVGRFGAHIGDVNAAGSYFAMMACLALALATAHGWITRAVWIASAMLLATGMWLTASWAAVAAGLGGLALLLLHWSARALGRSLTPGLALLIAGLVLVVGVVALAGTRRVMSPEGFILRRQFLETGLRMWESAPVFGVGVGMFYPLSRRFMGPQLGWNYSLENAHNYFLQIAAELGIVGLGVFLYFLYVVWTRARSSVSRRNHLFGAVTGAGAFVATWMTGHPLLVREVAYPFWILLGLVVVWAEGSQPIASPEKTSWRRQRVVLTAAALIVFASVPFRTEPPTRQTVMYGVHDWELQPDGRRARWTEQYATIVVRLETGTVDIPMRAPQAMVADVAVDGVLFKQVELKQTWQQVRLTLPPPAPEILYRRIDIRLPRSWPLAEIQPRSGDRRVVGIQLGELALSPVR